MRKVEQNTAVKMDGDLDPVWTYGDRGYYSMAFVGSYRSPIGLHNLITNFNSGYIFLYILIAGGFAPPTPSLIHFSVPDEVNRD